MTFQDRGGYEVNDRVNFERYNIDEKLLDGGDGVIYGFDDREERAWVIKRSNGGMVLVPFGRLLKRPY